ncbi:MAG: 30S ribosomal protein S12 methylthiotransferase RimO [Spirochaetales bacterium]|nr:30S ribosomal protein S12 methylthiotransferase RimO [Spirochaetales bacterium]
MSPTRQAFALSLSLSTERFPSRPTYFMENLGCAKNQVDAEVMMAALAEDGWVRSGDPDDAQVIIVNSCGFIEPAKQESIDTALDLSLRYSGAKIVMAGCLSQRYPDELAGEMPELSGIIGNRAPGRIAEFLRQMLESDTRVFVPETHALVPGTPATVHARGELLSLPGSAYVKVAEGCDNRCSFCAIPLIRGRLRSRRVDDLAREVSRLVESGILEINLVAQDLAAFGRDTGENLLELLEGLLEIDAHFWVRLLYVYPEHFPDELLDICARDPRVLPYFDIPFQHASTAILQRMGRPATAQQNLALIERIRSHLPGVFVRSTFLVGFYGETDRDFADLVEFQREAQIDWVGMFTYSPEDGTPAARFEGKLPLPGPEAHSRRDELMRLQEPITYNRVDRLVGAELDVLVEEMVPHEPLALGRAYAHAPDVDGAVVLTLGDGAASGVRPGALVRCRVLRRNGLDVEATPL